MSNPPDQTLPPAPSAPWWLRLLAYTRIPGNELRYWLDRRLPAKATSPALIQEEKDNLFASWPDQLRTQAVKREEELRARYRLAPLHAASTHFLYLKTLWLLSVWEEALGTAHPALDRAELQVVDAGSLSWDYVFALERFAGGDPDRQRQVHLLGIEINGQGRDRHGVPHFLRAQAHAAQTGNSRVRYRSGDFLALDRQELLPGGADLITLFYPFLFRYGLLLWGLPSRFFRPLALLHQAQELLRSGGVLLILLHTPAEQEKLLSLIPRLPGMRLAAKGPARCPLFPHGDPALLAARHYAVLRKSG